MRPILLSALALFLLACAQPIPTGRGVAARAPSSAATHSLACTQGDRKAALGTEREHPTGELVAKATGVDAYRREGGVWLARAPVLVNEDFDFATAMTMQGIGAGIAAAQRKANNERRAKELSAFTLGEDARSKLEHLRSCGIHRWGLLWGGIKPALTIVSDSFDAQGKVVESRSHDYDVKALEDPAIWLRDD